MVSGRVVEPNPAYTKTDAFREFRYALRRHSRHAQASSAVDTIYGVEAMMSISWVNISGIDLW